MHYFLFLLFQVLYGVIQKSTKIWSSLSTSQPPSNVRTSSGKFKFWTNAFIIKMFLTTTESQTNLSLVLFYIESSYLIMISELSCIFYLFLNFGCESLICWNELNVDIITSVLSASTALRFYRSILFFFHRLSIFLQFLILSDFQLCPICNFVSVFNFVPKF